MGETMENENAAFWLPTHFLTDDDFLAGEDLHSRRLPMKKEPNNFDLFSNGFDPFASPYPLDSPVSSTDTERDNDNDDDEFLAELTRHLAHSTFQETHPKSNPSLNPTEKPWIFSTSPQSTLTGFGPWSNRSGFSSNGSPNGPSQVPSPPLTPPGQSAKTDAAWELLYEAAGQVARLKMNAIAAQMKQQHQQQNRGLLGAPRNPSLPTKSHPLQSFYDFPHHNQFPQQVKRQEANMYCQHHQQQRRGCGGNYGGALGLPQSAWPPLRAGQPQQQPPHHNHSPRQQTTGGPGMRAMFLNGSGPGSGPVKKQSTGTGVFLPRRIGTQSQSHPEPRKKATGCSTVLLPARVVQALNLDLDEMNNSANFNSHPRFGSGFVTDHEILMARKNALLSQQRRSFRQEGGAAATMVGHDIRLPSDWTY